MRYLKEANLEDIEKEYEFSTNLPADEDGEEFYTSVKKATALFPYFKSVLEQDRSAVVICNLEHEIIYMNPAAVEHYAKYGGRGLIGKNLFECHNEASREQITKVISWFEESINHNIIYTFHNRKENKDVYMVALRDDNGTLIGYYEKHEYRDVETARRYDFV